MPKTNIEKIMKTHYQITIKINDTTYGVSSDFKDEISANQAYDILKLRLLATLQDELKFEYKKYEI